MASSAALFAAPVLPCPSSALLTMAVPSRRPDLLPPTPREGTLRRGRNGAGLGGGGGCSSGAAIRGDKGFE